MNPLELAFPNLASAGYRTTSPSDPVYNCLAWATGESDRWWWPDSLGVGYWPTGVVREETLGSFLLAYATLGFAPTTDDSLEPDTEKIAIYAASGIPTHAYRQLPNGMWTSKLGVAEDIEHRLNGLEGAIYGTVEMILKWIKV